MRTRLLAPLVVLFLVLAGAATAAATTGVFEANDSGLDSPRDIAENSTAVTSPSTSLPETTLPATTLPDDNVGDVGDNRTEDQTFVELSRPVRHRPSPRATRAASPSGATAPRSPCSSVNANAGFTSEIEQGTGHRDRGAVRERRRSGRLQRRARRRHGARTSPCPRCRSRTSRSPRCRRRPLPTTTTPTTTAVRATPTRVKTTAVRATPTTRADDHSGSGHSGADDSGTDDSGSDNSGSGHSGSGH